MYLSNFTSLYEFFGAMSLALVGFAHLQEYFAGRFTPKVKRYYEDWKKIEATEYNRALNAIETLRLWADNDIISKSTYIGYVVKFNSIKRYKEKEIKFSQNLLLNRTPKEEKKYAQKIVRLLAFWAALYSATILFTSGLSLSNEFSFDNSDIFYLNCIANFTFLSLLFYIIFRCIVGANRIYVHYRKVPLNTTFAKPYVTTLWTLIMFSTFFLTSVLFANFSINIFEYKPRTLLLGSILLCLIPIIGICDRYLIHLPLRVLNRKITQKKIKRKIKELSSSYQQILQFKHPK